MKNLFNSLTASAIPTTLESANYIKSLKPTATLLSAEKERALIIEAQHIGHPDNNKAVDELVSAYAKKILQIAKILCCDINYQCDYISISVAEFINCIMEFDTEREVCIINYAEKRIMGSLQSLRTDVRLIHIPYNREKLHKKYNNESSKSELPINLEDFAKKNGISLKLAEDIRQLATGSHIRDIDSCNNISVEIDFMRDHDCEIVRREMIRLLNKALKSKATIFFKVTGLLDGNPKKCKEVAEELGLSVGSVEKAYIRSKHKVNEDKTLNSIVREYISLAA